MATETRTGGWYIVEDPDTGIKTYEQMTYTLVSPTNDAKTALSGVVWKEYTEEEYLFLKLQGKAT